MEKIKEEFFGKFKSKPLFILEMANNHMGDVEHGLRIIREFRQITKKFNFNFGFKLQLRDINTFIHPDYKKKKDIPYVKRFLETKLKDIEFKKLKDEIEKNGFYSICTPFDELSVDSIENLNFNIVKIGSCSFTDWSLLERVVLVDKPIILSTAGATLDEIDKVVNFFQHRNKQFALMHCIGEYPTSAEHLQLNQLDLLKNRYSGIPIGFSTHEDPSNTTAIQIAIAKGAVIFEKHVGLKTQTYGLNAYSATPDMINDWLSSAKKAFDICGVSGKRYKFSKKELSDLRQFKRGVYAKKDIGKDEFIEKGSVFFAFPNVAGQLVANDVSKYVQIQAKKRIKKNEPILNVKLTDNREKVYSTVVDVRELLVKSGIILPNKLEFEISHHFGFENFRRYGATIVTVINREYCKKLIILLPGQIHPIHMHKQKEETFHVLYGTFDMNIDGKRQSFHAGDISTIERNVRHGFSTKTGGILEEVSTTHIINDSYYDDEKINKNKKRKTYLTYWSDL